jgi:hypothetical protein
MSELAVISFLSLSVQVLLERADKTTKEGREAENYEYIVVFKSLVLLAFWFLSILLDGRMGGCFPLSKGSFTFPKGNIHLSEFYMHTQNLPKLSLSLSPLLSAL